MFESGVFDQVRYDLGDHLAASKFADNRAGQLGRQPGYGVGFCNPHTKSLSINSRGP